MSGPNWISAAFEETFNLPYRHFHKPNVPIPSFWGTLAHLDLRRYAHLAVLPKMELSPAVPPPPTPPDRGHRNRLNVEHEPYRRLDFIYNISVFAETALDFCLTRLPSVRTGDADFDSENGGGITIASQGFQINTPMPIGKPSDVDKVLRWVMEYPLATVNHMMHLVHPDTIDYIVQEGGNDGHDKGLIRWAYWGRDENTITEALDTWSESVMVFVQPPWILTQADMEAFVGCPTFPAPTSQKKLKSYERLWGKIWDLCTQKRSHWFVLTTYWGWPDILSGRTRAFTSQIIPFDSKEPTVLQCLFFWFTSAVASQLPQQGAWAIPE
ncbi:uncharacterized protein TRAVEDRAFT_70851, partial [Trametes versicolor FP-101664 SS1]|uniref:uncharacterized protein n=1 Tax=Trametes versicolor (strain FP-101664) TaxID=717944 RepID=UPI00046236A2